jgi:hypothetical protein
MKFCKGTNSNIFAEVDVSCNGSYNQVSVLNEDKDLMYKRTSANIVPVWIIRCKLLVRTSFDNIDPSWDLKFARSLQM